MHHRGPDGSVSSDGRLFVSPQLTWSGRICVLAFGSLLFLFTPSRAVADFSGLVVSVLDGDTIEVLLDKRSERIRLSGIDCPEKGQAYGTRAKQAASELVFGKEVTLQTHALDKFKRTLGNVILPDGMNVNQELVKQGWCWWYRKYAPGDTVLKGLEKEAREAKKGLWIDPAPIPPWVYRKARRGQSLDLSDLVPLNSETENSGALAVPRSLLGAVQSEPTPNSTSSPTPSSATDEATSTTGLTARTSQVALRNREEFNTTSDAEVAGHRKAGNCP
jgi:micrococcal nuclease